MLTATTLEDTDVVEAAYDGRLDDESAAALKARMREVADRHGHVRLLLTIDEVGRSTPRAMLEDLTTAQLLDPVDRYAILADAGWIDQVARAGLAVLPVDGRVFGRHERGEAMAWLTT
jgi:hypothetical protein